MRRLPKYSACRIAEVYAAQRELNPDAHDQLLADLCAEVLTNGQGDDVARDDASSQVMDWIAAAHVEGAC